MRSAGGLQAPQAPGAVQSSQTAVRTGLWHREGGTVEQSLWQDHSRTQWGQHGHNPSSASPLGTPASACSEHLVSCPPPSCTCPAVLPEPPPKWASTQPACPHSWGVQGFLWGGFQKTACFREPGLWFIWEYNSPKTSKLLFYLQLVRSMLHVTPPKSYPDLVFYSYGVGLSYFQASGLGPSCSFKSNCLAVCHLNQWASAGRHHLIQITALGLALLSC